MYGKKLDKIFSCEGHFVKKSEKRKQTLLNIFG